MVECWCLRSKSCSGSVTRRVILPPLLSLGELPVPQFDQKPQKDKWISLNIRYRILIGNRSKKEDNWKFIRWSIEEP